MNVLVAVASKHGATRQIGEVIQATLLSSGHDAELFDAEAVESLDPYGAVVLGSGVYMGRWMRTAREFVDRYEASLVEMPVWLFSSGPIGDPPKPLENPAEVADVQRRLGARGHRLFPGKIDGSELRVAEKALIALVRAEQGDFRPWEDIAAWAESIADTLADPVTASA